MRSSRLILGVAYDGVQSLDVAGPLEVFHTAARLGGDYRVSLATPGGRRVRTSSGLTLGADVALSGAPAPDTLVVAGGAGAGDAARSPGLVEGVARAAAQARRVTSVCTGAFVLAAAGLLDGRRATTHWDSCALLARRHPAVRVDPAPIFVRDGRVWTSAGVTAGIDLALALVAEDHGRALSLRVARRLVVFAQRAGGQAQFSAELAAQSAEREPVRELQSWMADHLAEDLSVPALAQRAAMSRRHFARVFRRELGLTPAAYVEALRVEAARRALESGDRSLEAIAAACGFGAVETMHRAFRRRIATTPAQYRRLHAAAA